MLKEEFKFKLSKEKFSEPPRHKVNDRIVFTATLIGGYKYEITWVRFGIFQQKRKFPYYWYEVEHIIKEGYWIVID